jgi:tetratricopeptide (TPR) repeat protein
MKTRAALYNLILLGIAGIIPFVACSRTRLTPAQKDRALADMAFNNGNYREAESIYQRLLSEAPKDLDILSNLGVTQYRGGKLTQARATFERATTLGPDDAFSHQILGIICYCQQEYDEAITSLKRAIELEPSNAMSHNYLGIAYAAIGMNEEAAKEFELSKKLDPIYNDAPNFGPPPKVPDIHQA